jgi:hypothetical protein
MRICLRDGCQSFFVHHRLPPRIFFELISHSSATANGASGQSLSKITTRLGLTQLFRFIASQQNIEKHSLINRCVETGSGKTSISDSIKFMRLNLHKLHVGLESPAAVVRRLKHCRCRQNMSGRTLLSHSSFQLMSWARSNTVVTFITGTLPTTAQDAMAAYFAYIVNYLFISDEIPKSGDCFP